MQVQILPQAIRVWIDNAATTKTERRRIESVAGYIYRKFIHDGMHFDEPLDISTEHFRNQVGPHYLTALQRLKAAGVIQAVKNSDGAETYFAGSHGRLGRCKRYFFNPALVYSDPELCSGLEAAKKRFSADVLPTVRVLGRLKLSCSARKLPALTREIVTLDGVLAKMKVGAEIPNGAYSWAYCSTATGEAVRHGATPLPAKTLMALAASEGADLVLYNSSCYLCNIGTFAERRLYESRAALLYALGKLKGVRDRGNIFCSRNATNGRLDHNLTNIRSAALEHLTLDGEKLLQIDLKNSQFTFLAEIIAWFIEYCETGHINKNANIYEQNKTAFHSFNCRIVDKVFNILSKDISLINVTQKEGEKQEKAQLSSSFLSSCERFIFLTKRGLMYEALAEDMGQKFGRKVGRNEAKTAMFRACFSSPRFKDAAKEALRESLPGPVAFMDAWKHAAAELYRREGMPVKEAREHGSASLAVTLQTIEAALFVDVVLADLHQAGVSALTKHDSILYKPSDRAKVESAVRGALDNFFGPGGYVLSTE